MIREICKDEAFLAQKAKPATADDLCVAQDLLETLEAHKDGCVGMAPWQPTPRTVTRNNVQPAMKVPRPHSTRPEGVPELTCSASPA